MLGMRPTLAVVVCLCALHAKAQPKIPVKVVVVAMFERGADTGDEPGEYQYWVEREKLDRVIPFPQGYHDLRMNRDGGLGILTGGGKHYGAGRGSALRFNEGLLAGGRHRGCRSGGRDAGIGGMGGVRGGRGPGA